MQVLFGRNRWRSSRRWQVSFVKKEESDGGLDEVVRVVTRRLLLGRGGGRLDVVRQPGETLEEALSGRRATGHDVPDLVF